ncbi:MAG: ABC transporter substrate-binding protein, partial [Dehalococcoidia bacterium]
MAGRYSSVARRGGRVPAGAAALNRRRFLAAVAGAGAVTVAACSGSGANSSNGGSKGNAATQPEGAATAASPSAARGGSPAAGSSAVAGGSPAAKAATATPAPKKGGTIASGQVTDLNLNTGYPYVIWPQDGLLHSAVQEPLIRYRNSLQPEPVLAERFELNSDRTSLTITLRQGLTFHNGAPVTPEDVFFGLDVVLDPAKFGVKGGNFQIINFVKTITDRKKVDARTMQFTFDRPRVNIADLFAQLEIAQAASYDKLMKGEEIAGTGPNLFKTWN